MDRPPWPPDQPGDQTPADRARQRRLDHLRRSDGPRNPGGGPPRPVDAGPDQPRQRWYAQHAAREHDIERQRRDQAPDADPQQFRDNWYRQRYGYVPAPFRPEIAERVPDRARINDPTHGWLDHRHGGFDRLLESGYKTGFVDQLKERLGRLPGGFTNQNKTHVEAHAAAWLWLNPHIREVTIYVNNDPCRGKDGCGRRLPDMLPAGAQATLYSPDGAWRVIHGRATSPRQS